MCLPYSVCIYYLHYKLAHYFRGCRLAENVYAQKTEIFCVRNGETSQLFHSHSYDIYLLHYFASFINYHWPFSFSRAESIGLCMFFARILALIRIHSRNHCCTVDNELFVFLRSRIRFFDLANGINCLCHSVTHRVTRSIE